VLLGPPPRWQPMRAFLLRKVRYAQEPALASFTALSIVTCVADRTVRSFRLHLAASDVAGFPGARTSTALLVWGRFRCSDMRAVRLGMLARSEPLHVSHMQPFWQGRRAQLCRGGERCARHHGGRLNICLR